MTKPPKSRKSGGGGGAGPLLLFCAAAAVAGTAFDFASESAAGFWIGAQPGGGAALGAGAAAFAVLAGYAARAFLARPPQQGQAKENRDAGADA